MNTKRTLALASGRGSNFQAVVQAIANGELTRCEFVGLIVDRPKTGAADFASALGIPVFELDYKSYANRSDYDRKFAGVVGEIQPDLILAVGYMRILNPDFVREHSGRIINIHPALLPAFPGMHAQKQAFEYGVRVTGATVHFIDEGVDTGPIIEQAPVRVPNNCTLPELSALILEQEHRIIVRAVADFCEDRLRIQGRRVVRQAVDR